MMPNRAQLRVAVLCSRRAPGLMHLLTRADRRGIDWDIVCCLTSEETFAEEAHVAWHGIPIVHHPRRARELREDYDRDSVQLLAPYRPDVIVLSGYLLLLTRPMLAAFDGRILNVHHADLLLRDAAGGPRYPGLRAVRDAILAGETETRSTLHVVTERLDDGPPLLRSDAFPVSDVAAWAYANGDRELLRSAIWAHQEWMLRSAFGPLMEQALDALSEAGRRIRNAPLAPGSAVLTAVGIVGHGLPATVGPERGTVAPHRGRDPLPQGNSVCKQIVQVPQQRLEVVT